MTSADIVIAGAGALGSVAALTLVRAGRRVVVVDPAVLGVNASGVAAGMLAPAFESLFDDGDFRLLAAARDLWPALAADIGLPLARDGALALAERGEAQAWIDALRGAGAIAEVTAEGVFTPEDWRLEPVRAVQALHQAAEAEGVTFVGDRITGFGDGVATLASQATVAASALVVASGAGQDLAELVPQLVRLTPIKGHILRTADARIAAGPTLRAGGVYLCRGAGEAVLGATMEIGIRNPTVDPVIARRLLQSARPLLTGALQDADWTAAAGVRAATADGWPLVGQAAPGVFLAVGARRNGWLLAPLIAQTLLAAVEGRDGGEAARLFDPLRA